MPYEGDVKPDPVTHEAMIYIDNKWIPADPRDEWARIAALCLVSSTDEKMMDLKEIKKSQIKAFNEAMKGINK